MAGDLSGRILQGRYLVTAALASGGMSRVYVASDAHLPRKVCIKVFEAAGLDEDVVAAVHDAFVQEAYTLSQLSHPNTLRIYDFGFLEMAPRSPYHVCELMEGGTLATCVRAEGPMSRTAALAVVRPICGALAEAHACGVVHRDLKPSNILVGAAGPEAIVKLADFGISSIRSAFVSSESSRRLAMYSPGWAAPEQVRGAPVGPAADVYGLGLLWAFMRCGRRPFADDSATALEQQRRGEDHLRPALVAASLDAEEIEIVLHACHVDPAQRPAEVAALLASLEALGAPAPATAKAPPVAARCKGDVTLSAAAPEAIVGGRRARLLPSWGGVDLEIGRRARLRLRLLTDASGGHLHVRGLNCFLAKNGGRITRAVDLVGDAELSAYAIDHSEIARARLYFGVAAGGAIRFVVDGISFAVDGREGPAAVLLDEGAAVELRLLVAPVRSLSA